MNTLTILNTTSTNKGNKSNQSPYSRFKPLVATFVSTAVLLGCMVVPTASSAATTDKFCYDISSLMSGVIQNNTDKRAIELIENAIAASKKDDPTLTKVHAGLESMLYFGLTKKGIFRGDNLTKLLMLKCPSFFE
jgi:maltodextrin utilization protein YvdJ